MLDSANMKLGRKTLALLLLVGAAVPALGARTVTAEQFSQWLAAEHGKSDAKMAEQIQAMELSERASAANLAQWQTESHGSRTRAALIALADASQFLPPPGSEILQKPAPDLTAQQAMLSSVVRYVSNTLPKLPDFSATRETMHFEDQPSQQLIQGPVGIQGFGQTIGVRSGPPSSATLRSSPGQPIHFVAQSSVMVTYRNGLEVHDTQNGKAAQTQAAETRAAEGFTTSGEFGPVLSVIVGDAVDSDVHWGYWRQDSVTAAAVFRYSVPQEHSHFTVALPNAQQTVTFSPAYHGEIAIDPATGSILRLTLISDPQPPYQQLQIEIMVEYAPVVIADRTYICPVKSVAVSRIPIIGAFADAKHPAPVKTRLNDVSFTRYHLFRTESTILQ
jgi:hypothetical protein